MEQGTSQSNCSGTLEDMTDLNQEGRRIQPCVSHAVGSACCFSSEAGLEASVASQEGGTVVETPGEGAAGDGKQVSWYLLKQ